VALRVDGVDFGVELLGCSDVAGDGLEYMLDGLFGIACEDFLAPMVCDMSKVCILGCIFR
jgi:hypothetical protein